MKVAAQNLTAAQARIVDWHVDKDCIVSLLFKSFQQAVCKSGLH